MGCVGYGGLEVCAYRGDQGEYWEALVPQPWTE